ncbi:sigma-70 family RNA polymerase sigma factor [Streptomyces sp. NPDC048191]|uniref:sigma-70 family RNA polymerase sigma factor n=1 Tax=Streptomyces sp. NPDC048191 TaxID=3155484 RepID=UPI0034072BA2
MRLLERYADTEGYVTSRALEGVVRLAGLNAREAAALREAARVRPEKPSVDTTADATPEEAPGRQEAASGGRAAGEMSAFEEPSVAEEQGSPEQVGEPPEDFLPEPSGTVVRTDADVAAAVAAARAVMREDRMRRRPENRLLTAQEEVGLAVLVRGAANEEPDQETLSALPPEDIRIRARDCLVVHNQRLVHSLVPRYLEQGLDYDDLFQHGALGLMRAARKFDAAKGFKFSTYATWWIRQSITRGLWDEGTVIRIPVHMHERIRKVAGAERTLAAQGRPATTADVAVLCDLSLSKVEEARRLSRRTDSLDRVIGDGATLGDFVARTRAVPPFEEQVHNALLLTEAMTVVDTFSGRDHRILVRRLGLDDEPPSTLDQLGGEFGVTRERIRQLEVKLVPELRERLRRARLLRVGGSSVPEESGNARSVSTGAARRRVSRAARPARLVRAVGPAARSLAAPPSGRATTEAEMPPAGGMTTDRATSVDAADRARARRPADEPSGQAGLANYALAAVGGPGLAEILGPPAADAVLRIAREREPADHSVLMALEVLRRVFDAVAEAGLRPEDFLDRSFEALCGVTPRAYLARKPLVHGEPRLAMRDALREFLAAPRALAEAVTAEGEAEAPAPPEATDQRSAELEPTERAPTGPEQTADQPACDAPTAAADEPDAEAAESQQSRTTAGAAETPAGAADAEETAADAVGTDDMPVRTQYTADWHKARELTAPPFGGGLVWLAEYALLAVGHLQLAVLLGSSAADAVVRAGRERGMLDRRVISALEVLQGVFDVLRELELRPEHFFEWTSEALGGTTPRAYLAAKPLVDNASRLAIQDALNEFASVRVTGSDADADAENGDGGASQDAPVETGEDVERRLAEAHARHEAEVACLTQAHERRIAEERQAADARVTAALAQAEQQLDSWEEILLNRADKALARREQYLRRQADERVARLKEEQREATVAATRRAQERIVDLEIRLRHTESAASTAGAERVSRFQARAEEAEQRLRRYREETEARIAHLEARLRQAETRLIARDRAMYEAGQRAAADVEQAQQWAEAAERRAEALVSAADQAEARAAQGQQIAAARLAQVEHDAWARISELQAQLAALQAPAAGRASLRDRWRRP